MMPKRFAAYLDELAADPAMAFHVSRLKLSAADLELARSFAEAHEVMCPHERMVRIQRMFIDQPAKPKRWIAIMELLTLANSRAVREIDPTGASYRR